MKPSEVLQEALTELKKGPQTWTKDAFAKLENGDHADSITPEAVCRCAIGHVEYAAFKLTNTRVDELETCREAGRYVNKAITGRLPAKDRRSWRIDGPIVTFNDKEETKYEDVVAIFEKAFVLAKKVGR